MAKTVSPLLPSMGRILKELGENIRLARLRRRLSATLLAQRAGISRVTLKKVESGDPGSTLGAYAHVLQSLGLAGDLAQVACDDELGRKLQDAGMRPARSPSKARTKGEAL
jgi:transcriptional regulator with XRE-family HTH domain